MATLLARTLAALTPRDATTCPASINGGTATCGNPFSRAEAKTDGHPGFCSHECAVEDLENSAM